MEIAKPPARVDLLYKDDRTSSEFRSIRGLTAKTCEFYGIRHKLQDSTPVAIIFPYNETSGKVRSFDGKEFTSYGEMKEAHLFGKVLFPPGSSDSITITEGEFDAPSIFQATERPAVSVRSSSQARKDCVAEREYLNSFKKIYLAFDNDKNGNKAAQEVAELFDFNKVYRVQLDKDLKDANGYLQDGKQAELRRAWWASKRFMPEGVLSSMEEFYEALDDATFQEPLGSFPWEELQNATYGLRPGESTLFTALEGIGKTEFLRAIEHHLLKTTEHNIGIIHLEENKARTLKGLVGLELKQPVHLPDTTASKDDVKKSLVDLVKRDDRLHVYSHFGSDDPDIILDTIRFMAGACECRIIFLDHITMLATGLVDADERKTLDYISTKLGQMVNDLKFHLVLISHVNDDGQTRGSRNISKIANTRIDLSRDIESSDERVRNTTKLMISKNRFASVTGPVGELYFNRETFSLEEAVTSPEQGLPS